MSAVDLQKWYLSLKPKTVVEVGPGSGSTSRLLRPIHKSYWYGLEAWAPYVTQCDLWEKYDRVIISDVRHVDFMTVCPDPDLVIIRGVLNNMERDESEVVLQKIKAWTRDLFVSIGTASEPLEGNWFEANRDKWTHDSMMGELNEGLVKYKTGYYYHWNRRRAAGYD